MGGFSIIPHGNGAFRFGGMDGRRTAIRPMWMGMGPADYHRMA